MLTFVNKKITKLKNGLKVRCGTCTYVILVTYKKKPKPCFAEYDKLTHLS